MDLKSDMPFTARSKSATGTLNCTHLTSKELLSWRVIVLSRTSVTKSLVAGVRASREIGILYS